MTALAAVIDWAALGAAIREAREQSGMDRGRLAEFVGLQDGQAVCAIEEGRVTVSERTLSDIAKALRASPDWLQARAWRIYTDALSHAPRGDAA